MHSIDLEKITEDAAVWNVNAYMRSFNHLQDIVGTPVFVPVQSGPESEAPYITYNWRTIGENQWWKYVDQVVYAIYTSDIRTSNNIINFMKDVLSRQDDSARELNAWLKENDHNDFQFYTFELVSAGQLAPATEEGGVMPRLVSFRYEYSHKTGTGIV